MTRAEIDTICQCFLDSDLAPEDFFNQYTEEHKTNFGFTESSVLIKLFYQLREIDPRIIQLIPED